MKIVNVEPLRVGQFLYAYITAEGGYSGIGESGAWGHVEASVAAINKFSSYLVGKDAREIEHHWNVMHRFSYFQGAAINGAISAIDIALWDLKAKSLRVPVYELLGGAVRKKARVYGHAYDKTAAAVANHCKTLKEHGFTAIGHLNPLLDETDNHAGFKPNTKFIDDAVNNVALFRDAVGSDCDLLIELHRRMTPAQAVEFINRIECYQPMWCEDPIRPEDPDSMAWVANRVNVPIATGERFTSLYDFQTLLTRRGVQFARTSLGVCGGITGAKKIAALAEAHNVQVAPHSPLSPVSLAACLQLAAAIPNFAIQEFTTGLEDHSLVSGITLLGQDIVDWQPQISQGHIDISDRPGIGVALLDDAKQRRSVVTKPVAMRANFDGSPIDQ